MTFARTLFSILLFYAPLPAVNGSEIDPNAAIIASVHNWNWHRCGVKNTGWMGSYVEIIGFTYGAVYAVRACSTRICSYRESNE
jgi:hypothetical protein